MFVLSRVVVELWLPRDGGRKRSRTSRASVRSVVWPRDDAKLDRVRALMADADVDALVVRAPDNVLYLTNFWAMKGYDVAIFPREGEPALVCLEASEADACASAWTSDVHFFRGYDERDPRPPQARATETAQRVVRERGYGRIGLELSLGTQASDRMVGEPTTYTHDWFLAFGTDVVDATPLLVQARLPGSVRGGRLRPGMRESEAGALWNGFVHGEGTGWAEGRVTLAHGFSLVWSGEGIRTFTATGDRPVQEHEPTLFEIWVCADGYWCDHTKNLCPGELTTDYAELLERLTAVYDDAVAFARPGASLAELDVRIRDGLAAAGYPGQPTHPICHGVGARAHEPPYAHQAGGGTVEAGMVLAIEPGVYWPDGGGLRLEDNFLVTAEGVEKLSSFPDGVVCG
jgi:Xaa-Pro aminopeptidase